ncbi:MAG: hypothetical protein ACRDZ5_01800 [Acidimicrobiales bacterium]
MASGERAEFLSEEFFEELARAVEATSASHPDRSLRLGQVVTGVPLGGGGAKEEDEVSYIVRLGGPDAGVERSSACDAEVTLIVDHCDGAALHRGETTAGALLEQGRIKVRGDAGRLTEESDLLTKISSGVPENIRDTSENGRTVT